MGGGKWGSLSQSYQKCDTSVTGFVTHFVTHN